MEYGTWVCEDCGRKLDLFGYVQECAVCGGRLRLKSVYERGHDHPLEYMPKVSESYINETVERGMAMIMARLEAESELDRIENFWYNRGKGDTDDKEVDNPDPLSL